jgi:hypothetical protein
LCLGLLSPHSGLLEQLTVSLRGVSRTFREDSGWKHGESVAHRDALPRLFPVPAETGRRSVTEGGDRASVPQVKRRLLSSYVN